MGVVRVCEHCELALGHSDVSAIASARAGREQGVWELLHVGRSSEAWGFRTIPDITSLAMKWQLEKDSVWSGVVCLTCINNQEE